MLKPPSRALCTRATTLTSPSSALFHRPREALLARHPLVAIVGAPNAGKSTLFNRLVEKGPGLAAFRPRALVSPMAGTTRDRLESTVEWNDTTFRLVDTGGVHQLDETLATAAAAAAVGGDVAIERLVESQVLTAVRGASVVLFVVDAVAGVTLSDERLAPLMRKLASRPGPPHVLLAVNKVDHERVAERCGFFADFWTLGIGEPHPFSAYHGRGVEALLEALHECLPPPAEEEEEAEEEEGPIERPIDATPDWVVQAAAKQAEVAAVAAGVDETDAEAAAEAAAEEAAVEEAAAEKAAADEYYYAYEEYEGEEAVESASSEPGAGSSAGRSESFFDEERGDFFAPPHELKLAVVGRPNVTLTLTQTPTLTLTLTLTLT